MNQHNNSDNIKTPKADINYIPRYCDEKTAHALITNN